MILAIYKLVIQPVTVSQMLAEYMRLQEQKQRSMNISILSLTPIVPRYIGKHNMAINIITTHTAGFLQLRTTELEKFTAFYYEQKQTFSLSLKETLPHLSKRLTANSVPRNSSSEQQSHQARNVGRRKFIEDSLSQHI